MSVVISADSPALAAPAAAVLPVAAAGLPMVADDAAAGLPFDVALQACLMDLPATEGVEQPDMEGGNDLRNGEDAAAATAADETPATRGQDLSPLLMATLPPSPAASWVAPPVVTPDGVTQAAATQATPATDSASRPASVPVGGDAGAIRLIALSLAAGHGSLRPLQATLRSESAPADTPARAAAAQPLPERGLTAVATMAVTAGAAAGEVGRPAQADGVERPLPLAMPTFAQATAGTPSSAEAPLRLPNGDAGQWRQPLLQALGERLQFASEKGIDSAVIRLEPPRMGSIEIAIRHQDGALQVNLSATHNEVLRQLQDISDNLRHSLGQRHAGDVSVQVADTASSRPGQGDGERQRQRQAQSEQNPGRALGDAEAEGGTTSFRLARNEE